MNPRQNGDEAQGMADEATREFVSFRIGRQLFGIEVKRVRDVLRPHPITRIPLAPPEIAGSLNLRGRIVTVVDIGRRLGLPAAERPERHMSIVVEHGDDLYSLIVEAIGDVLSLSALAYERNPMTLDARWREASGGIYRLEGELLVVLEVSRLLGFPPSAKVA